MSGFEYSKRLKNRWVKQVAEKTVIRFQRHAFYLCFTMPYFLSDTGDTAVWPEFEDVKIKFANLEKNQLALIENLKKRVEQHGIDLAIWQKGRYRSQSFQMHSRVPFAMFYMECLSRLDKICMMYDALKSAGELSEDECKKLVYAECRRLYKRTNYLVQAHNQEKRKIKQEEARKLAKDFYTNPDSERWAKVPLVNSGKHAIPPETAFSS